MALAMRSVRVSAGGGMLSWRACVGARESFQIVFEGRSTSDQASLDWAILLLLF